MIIFIVKKNHMIASIGVEISFDKIQNLFIKKYFKKPRNRRELP